jgi:hypothetical protein
MTECPCRSVPNAQYLEQRYLIPWFRNVTVNHPADPWPAVKLISVLGNAACPWQQ